MNISEHSHYGSSSARSGGSLVLEESILVTLLHTSLISFHPHLLDLAMAEQHLMSTPVRSPAVKKMRGDDNVGAMELSEDDEEKPPAWANSLKSELVSEVKSVLRQEMKTLRTEVGALQTNVAEIQGDVKQLAENLDITTARVTMLEQSCETDQASESFDLRKKIMQIEKDIELLRSAATSSAEGLSDMKVTAVVGLNGTTSSDEALTEFHTMVWNLYIDLPMQAPFIKGEFTGVVFVKFDTETDRDTFVSKIRSSEYTVKEKTV